MQHPLRALTVSGAALMLVAGLGTAASAAARTAPARTPPPAVLHVGQIDRQDVPPRGTCQPDTLVEPDVAVSPVNPRIQVAAAHDCRFDNGGAVDISYAWTHDGGATWHHAPVPGITRAVGGGVWARASDPVVAFGADGSVYLSVLVFNLGCPSGVAVLRSTDGGATFGPPVMVHVSNTCMLFDDKNWIIADTQPHSPFHGRVYQFWTEFFRGGRGPQVVRWSDDQGRHWSATHVVGSATENTQDSQPFIAPDGAITDVYQHFFSVGGAASAGSARAQDAAGTATTAKGVPLWARTSSDGGATWSRRVIITRDTGGGPPDIRCCLPLATGDPATGHMFAVWNANGPGTQDAVMLSSSPDGRHWSAPVQVTHGNNPDIQYLNAAVAAGRGRVFVSYGARNLATHNGNFVQQELTWSTDGGARFGSPIALGPVSNLKFSASSRGHFPGDYTGLSLTPTRLTAAWCVSSKPPNPSAQFHQVLFAATLRP